MARPVGDKVGQREDTLDDLSRRADPDWWTTDRHYTPAYRFADGRRIFKDHRDNVYQD